MDGVDWRSWSGPDRASAVYILLKRTLSGDGLRDLYQLVGDTDALGQLDREVMGQTGGVQLTDMGVARG